MYSALAVADAAYDAYKLSQLHYITTRDVPTGCWCGRRRAGGVCGFCGCGVDVVIITDTGVRSKLECVWRCFINANLGCLLYLVYDSIWFHPCALILLIPVLHFQSPPWDVFSQCVSVKRGNISVSSRSAWNSSVSVSSLRVSFTIDTFSQYSHVKQTKCVHSNSHP